MCLLADAPREGAGRRGLQDELAFEPDVLARSIGERGVPEEHRQLSASSAADSTPVEINGTTSCLKRRTTSSMEAPAAAAGTITTCEIRGKALGGCCSEPAHSARGPAQPNQRHLPPRNAPPARPPPSPSMLPPPSSISRTYSGGGSSPSVASAERLVAREVAAIGRIAARAAAESSAMLQ